MVEYFRAKRRETYQKNKKKEDERAVYGEHLVQPPHKKWKDNYERYVYPCFLKSQETVEESSLEEGKTVCRSKKSLER